MDDEKRGNLLRNVSEDVAQLLVEECVKLGKRKLYDQLFDDVDWCQWRYSDSAPESVEEYALDSVNGTLKAKQMPDYASKSALVDFFRDELREDLVKCRKRFSGREMEADGE